MTTAAGTQAARACSLDAGPSSDLFAPQHPRSVQVALAVRQAVAEDAIDPLGDSPSPWALYKVTSYLGKLQALLSQSEHPMDGDHYVLIVEYGLWARIYPSGKDQKVKVHVEKPDAGARVIVTGDAAMRAIVDGKITLGDAVSRGLLEFTGPESSPFSWSGALALDDAFPAQTLK